MLSRDPRAAYVVSAGVLSPAFQSRSPELVRHLMMSLRWENKRIVCRCRHPNPASECALKPLANHGMTCSSRSMHSVQWWLVERRSIEFEGLTLNGPLLQRSQTPAGTPNVINQATPLVSVRLAAKASGSRLLWQRDASEVRLFPRRQLADKLMSSCWRRRAGNSLRGAAFRTACRARSPSFPADPPRASATPRYVHT